MKVKKTNNPEAKLAESYALNTTKSFFLTGKAGTGKTTFLHKLVDQTNKNTIVVAPTGVAAINAEGSTIHSMFGFPLKIFIPSHEYTDANIAVNKPLLIKHLRYRDEKRKLLKELELLIIDEVSMVRADLLDAIDFSLQYVRKDRRPFGGVQLILIGDLLQLPPIVQNEEWQILKNHYHSPHFFASHAWQAVKPFTIELRKIYRQDDATFINILNNIREGETKKKDLDQLNRLYQPDFNDKDGDYLTLSTHNYKADQINQSELARIDKPSYKFKAKIEGSFNESAYPVEEVLELKVGAQVMFTRNDVEEGRYYNGKIGTIASLDEDEIWIQPQDEEELIELQAVSWENKKYTLDKETNDIQQETLGSFTQYPIRLAWAITIHKSQGLTFEKAVIDAADAFATGQTYVALSRCRRLDGIVLKSKVRLSSIKADQRVLNFMQDKSSLDDLHKALENEKRKYARLQLIRLFDLKPIRDEIINWQEEMMDKNLPEKEKCLRLGRKIRKEIKTLIGTQKKYEQYLKSQFNSPLDSGVRDRIISKTQAAVSYFTEKIFKNLISPLHKHIGVMAYKKNSKKHVQTSQALEQYMWAKVNQLYDARYLNTSLYKGEPKFKPEMLPEIKARQTKKKGNTYEDTLNLYNEGKSVPEIAKIRSLKESTIHGHLSRWILKGEIPIDELLDGGKVEQLLPYFERSEDLRLAEIKRTVPFDTNFDELKYVLAHYQRQNE